LNINDYFMKVENLAYVFAYIGALLDDDDLVVMN
jgi:hypothetical protein